MKSEAMTRALISTAVDKGLNDIARDPKRSIRQLIDLGTFFAKGRFQRYFFDIFGEMLHNDSSPYYGLVSGIVNHVDPKLLKTFGMNLIYNGWTVGAKTVRSLETASGKNMPWTFLLSLGADGETQLADIQALIDRGRAQGIFSYMFLCEAGFSPAALREILLHNGSCAFILFLAPCAVDESLCAMIQEAKNAFVLIDMRAPGFAEKAALLRSARCLFGASYPYGEADAGQVCSGALTSQAVSAKAPFLFFTAQPDCPMAVQKAVCAYTMQARQAPKGPVLYIDLYSDLAYIDDIISSEPSCLHITANGKPPEPDDFRPFPQQWLIRPHPPGEQMALLLRQDAPKPRQS